MTNNIKKSLKALNVTQSQLAERLGITFFAVNKMVNNQILKFETYEKVANALNVPAWTLFLDDDEIAAIRAGEQTSNNPDSNTTEVASKCPYCNRDITVKVGITK